MPRRLGVATAGIPIRPGLWAAVPNLWGARQSWRTDRQNARPAGPEEKSPAPCPWLRRQLAAQLDLRLLQPFRQLFELRVIAQGRIKIQGGDIFTARSGLTVFDPDVAALPVGAGKRPFKAISFRKSVKSRAARARNMGCPALTTWGLTASQLGAAAAAAACARAAALLAPDTLGAGNLGREAGRRASMDCRSSPLQVARVALGKALPGPAAWRCSTWTREPDCPARGAFCAARRDEAQPSAGTTRAKRRAGRRAACAGPRGRAGVAVLRAA